MAADRACSPPSTHSPSAYSPLWVKSNHSFLEGASFPTELVEAAHAHGLGRLALTDRDGVYGLVRAHVRGRELGVRVIPGAQVSVGLSPSHPRGERHRVVLIARDEAGYGALCRLLSAGRQRCDKGDSLVTVDEVAAAAGGLFALCPDEALVEPLAQAYGPDLFALVARHRLAAEPARERALRAAAERVGARAVAAVEVLYHEPERRPIADVVACIRAGCTLTEAGRVIRPNAEHALPSADAMAALFADTPELVAATNEVAVSCGFGLEQLDYRYPAEARPDGRSQDDWLRELAFDGAGRRYPDGVPDDVQRQLDRELALILELGYGGYFLTMREIVDYCRRHDILCQGRGSAANSAVCFCLGITAIDPVRMDLLFERFLSRERAEPPDIDLDIEHERREEVIQHVYERYGRRHAAMVANVIRYRARSAVRDVGKVLGITRTDLDAATRLLRHHDDLLDEALLREAGLDPAAPATRHLCTLATGLLDFPRHLSIHPGGFLLGERPVDTIVPIEPATMAGRTVIQWDKYDVEALGLFKVDLLGLGCLTAVHRCFDLLRDHDGLELEIATVPQEDPATYEMASRGDTVGVFQIESRAQMAMLPRLRPSTFYDLVIEVAIVRPGPIQGGMVHPYLRRRSGEERVEYPHEDLRRVLEKTLGVPLFQEQVMKLAVIAADYTAGEADQLRRDMGAWRRSGRIDEHRERLVGRMVEKGISEEFAERVFSQIRGFGEYGFPESHAASFALLAYVTSWLKCHHPAAFTCAMLNAQPMGFYSPSTLLDDAKRHGVEVAPLSARGSVWDCALEPGRRGGHRIRMGLRYVKGLGQRERVRLEAAGFDHDSLPDFVRATRLSQRALVHLAEAGAFDVWEPSRRDALWAVRSLAAYAKDPLPLEPAPSAARFQALSVADEVAWDYRASSHSSRGHPMQRFRATLDGRGVPTAEVLDALPDGAPVDYVGVVLSRQRPGTASGVHFLNLADESGFVNVVLWKRVVERYSTLTKTAVMLGVRGKIQSADGVTHLIADALYLPDFPSQPTPRSRDFR